MKELISNKQRIEYIDILRGLVILIVIYGHSGCLVKPEIAIYYQTFYMSIFFLFSGILRKDNLGVINTIKKNIKTLYIPYLIWLLGTMMFFALIDLYKGVFDFESYIITFKEGVFGISHPHYVAQYWFIMTFITLQIVYSILDKIFKNIFSKTVVVIVLTIGGLVAHYIGIKNTPFRIETACIVLPIFCFGIWVKRFGEEKFLGIKNPVLIVLFFVHLMTTYINYFLYDSKAISLWAENYNNYALFYFNAILGMVVWMNIAKKIDKIDNIYLQKMLDGIKFMGRNSIVALLDMNLLIYIFAHLLSKIPFVGENRMVICYIACILTVLAQVPIVKILSNKRLKFIIGK